MSDLPAFSTAAKQLHTGIYEHYKGQRYQVLAVGRDSETLEEVVVYKALYGEHDIWVRPLDMFLGTVAIDGKEVLRFQFITDEMDEKTLHLRCS
ncbi:MAG: DUF1653 domain-containing protein [Verrucomicrobiota bacterium]|nr:DUF1653 domain-containing protein [Verrucomicrobiota bacterium]